MLIVKGKKLAVLRRTLPYGKYIQSDGTEVFFNRRYEPIWRKAGDQVDPVDPVDPAERVVFIRQEWFFNDSNPPWRNRETMAKCRDILRQLGVE